MAHMIFVLIKVFYDMSDMMRLIDIACMIYDSKDMNYLMMYRIDQLSYQWHK